MWSRDAHDSRAHRLHSPALSCLPVKRPSIRGLRACPRSRGYYTNQYFVLKFAEKLDLGKLIDAGLYMLTGERDAFTNARGSKTPFLQLEDLRVTYVRATRHELRAA